MASGSSQTSSFSTGSPDIYKYLSTTLLRTIPVLLGRSNFEKWHTSIASILVCSPEATSLIQGNWAEPSSTSSNSSYCSGSSCISKTPSLNDTMSYQDYEQANLMVCRFIRGSLAMNVAPFVRQHTSAKALYEQLIYLYGDARGIDMVGGPRTPGTRSGIQGKRAITQGPNRPSDKVNSSLVSSKKQSNKSQRPLIPTEEPSNRREFDARPEFDQGGSLPLHTLIPHTRPSKPQEGRKPRFKFNEFVNFRRRYREKNENQPPVPPIPSPIPLLPLETISLKFHQTPSIRE